MLVDRADLESTLAQLRQECADPELGPWGPDSVMWRVAREKAVLLAGGRAALLQLAHPAVGEAVASSELATRAPLLRFQRTFVAVHGMVFGTLEQALQIARHVHRVHEGVRSPAYDANETSALQWVLATLVDGSVLAYELTQGPMSPVERERFWQDARKVGLLFGLEGLPEDWTSFSRYVQQTLASDTLAVTPRASEVGRRLLLAPDLATQPFWATYRAVTAALMPARFRAPFHLRLGVRERMLARSALLAVRLGYRRVPARVRCVPAYHEARWRLQGRGPHTDRMGRWLEETSLALLLRPTR
jgi:uncharacterized protein (DUF2236 family)